MIKSITIKDVRFSLDKGAGSDAIHRDPVYSYAVTILEDETGLSGTGLAFTLGEGNDMVCRAARFYAGRLKGKDIEELMVDFGQTFNALSNEQQFRWLGPHKGVVHLGLASVTNACFDLWAKKRGVLQRPLACWGRRLRVYWGRGLPAYFAMCPGHRKWSRLSGRRWTPMEE